jgi:hypothetical protein
VHGKSFAENHLNIFSFARLWRRARRYRRHVKAPPGYCIKCDMTSASWAGHRQATRISPRVPNAPSQGGVSCGVMTISTICLAFEVTRKRRRGLSVRNARSPRRSHRPRRQGADRETRTKRSVPLRLRKKLSKNAACAPVASTAANGSIMCTIEVFGGSARLDRRGSALPLSSLPNAIRRSMMALPTRRKDNHAHHYP